MWCVSRSSRLRADTDQPSSSWSSICSAENARSARQPLSASGMPSRRRHSAATLSMSSMTAPARSSLRRTGDSIRVALHLHRRRRLGSRSGATTRTSSPATPSASRLVARTRTPGLPTTRPTTSAVASSTCSQLSTTRRSERGSSASRDDRSRRRRGAATRRTCRGTPRRPRPVRRPGSSRRTSTRGLTAGELDREPCLADPPGPASATSRERATRRHPLEVVVPPEERVGRLGMFVGTLTPGRAAIGRRQSRLRRPRGTGSRARARCR